MTLRKTALAIAFTALVIACNSEGNKKAGADYSKLKTELNLTGEKATKFSATTDKYDAERKTLRESMGEKPDRIALFTKFEEIQKKQDAEIQQVLSAEEFTKYNDFVAKNTRKRPRYNDELLAKIKSEVGLSDQQMQIVNAANNAFEKAFSDAHDVYHGNTDLAKEYWNKFDAQRKAAIEKSLTPEQVTKFLDIVKDQQFKGKE